MPQKEPKKGDPRKKVISTDKAALLWMYCKEIAPFETPTFSKNAGEVIARATRGPRQLETQEQLISRSAQQPGKLPLIGVLVSASPPHPFADAARKADGLHPRNSEEPQGKR
jgi:hypothetical protein